MHVPLLVLAITAAASAAPAAECAGGSIRSLRLETGRLAFTGTVTRAGLAHGDAPGRTFRLRLADAGDGAVLYEVSLPGDAFVRRPRRTIARGQAPFRGAVRFGAAGDQADTVRIRLTDPAPSYSGPLVDRVLRAHLTIGDGCARTCIVRCRRSARGLRCRPSRRYVPFADAGFGRLRGRPPARRTSTYCGLAVDAASPCDPLIAEHCLLPFPSSVFLRPDPSTPTGVRLAYPAEAMPRNAQGTPIDPTDWNTLDGFSPGAMLMALFPDSGLPVDLAASRAATPASYPRSLEADSPTVLVRARDGTRVPHFAELDANTDRVDRRALILRPGLRLDDASRYLVAIRGLVDTAGRPLPPGLAFRALRDRAGDDELEAACGRPCADALAARRATLEPVFESLAAIGIERRGLLLAWDFTTASTSALTAWMVAIRDQARALGTPAFTVTDVDDGPGGVGRDANIFRRIQGTFQAPLFLSADAPGARLNVVDGVPRQNGWAAVPFVVDIPHVAVNAGGEPRPARATTWGHGLLGNRFQLGTLSELAQRFNFVVTAVDMQGMSDADVPAILPLVRDLSLFHRIPERLHQGFLNHLLLGRLMSDPVLGFNGHPAFRFGSPSRGIIDTTEVYYAGGSQGGIFGAAIMAVAEDFRRGFLAVPGSNYSTLLHRSIDFDPFLAILRSAYPDPLDEQLVIALVQQLWDRAEPHGYLPHLLGGGLSTPPVPHAVLIHMATHDSEVSNVATEIMVRSLGIPQLAPVHRSFFVVPEREAPFTGSAFVEIDPQLGFSRCNTPGTSDPGAPCASDADCPGVSDPPTRTRCDSGVPPTGNTAPPFNNRAHGSTGTLAAGRQIDAFLRPDGRVEQFCAGPCDPE